MQGMKLDQRSADPHPRKPWVVSFASHAWRKKLQWPHVTRLDRTYPWGGSELVGWSASPTNRGFRVDGNDIPICFF